ncbi:MULTISPECIES: enediyne biosynthesis protein [Streptomyces]|uniref:enediyne biosynthesis protein n=1 Tax=Streptomyces TaxID=1883 RepID=UPI0005C92B26|nr:enediyne biosynthesis protein [Streptomyces globisporus]PPA38229.1 enediyne biosynthesis protein [Streptomyces griseus]RAN13398.1 enediyne biosynthesis protein [Streptomyces badius]RAN22173.1 enediyne biosynthesis protein [Streptomyces badius]
MTVPGSKTLTPAPRHDVKVTTALRRFAISISILNIAGYTFLGFEQPWLWPFIAVLTAYAVEIVLEAVSARGEKRAPRYAGGGFKGMVEFLFPAHITGLAVNMLTYVNDRVWVMVFGVIVAVGTKWVLRAPLKGRMRHYMNPSNFGIAMILVLFPWASIAPPYHFTEYLYGPADWVLPAIILVLGTMLNAKLTGRMWLIMAWLGGFVVQAVVRGLVMGTSIPAALGMMTGVAFVLFTNYMVTDPGTSPSKRSSQIFFGAGVAAMYGVLTALGIAYGIFFATALICLIRGGYLWGLHFLAKQREAQAPPALGVQGHGPDTAVEQMAAAPATAAASGPVDGSPEPATVVLSGNPCKDGTCFHGKCAAERASKKKAAVPV